ncbi:MAG: ribose-phosphate diphosphokinase [Clostridiales bacterium]|nr:ribose-phosphate diphosphokinase [Clostridiales bacterium]
MKRRLIKLNTHENVRHPWRNQDFEAQLESGIAEWKTKRADIYRPLRIEAGLDNHPHAPLSIIGLRGDCLNGSDGLLLQVEELIKLSRGEQDTDKEYVIYPDFVRFDSGEGKAVLANSVRGHDIYIYADVFNHGVKYLMYGEEQRYSPDDHYADLKRVIGAIMGKASRVSIIMPMLYEGRQHRRSLRESLDCAIMLQELRDMGISNFLTFDAHDPRVQNAIPLLGFDDVHTTHQMIKALVNKYGSELSLDRDKIIVVSPDEGGMSRNIYFSEALKLDLSMFWKRRDYTRVVNGKNPIIEHKYIGADSLEGLDIIISDDMIASGASLIDVADQLKAQGVNRIFAFSPFGLFCGKSTENDFDKAYEKGVIEQVFTTNLIYRPDWLCGKPWYTEVDLSRYLAMFIDTLNRDMTISSLLNTRPRIMNFLIEEGLRTEADYVEDYVDSELLKTDPDAARANALRRIREVRSKVR